MVTKDKYEFSKIYLSEYCHFDGEDDIKFIVIDINLDKSVITCMLNKTGKFFVQASVLLISSSRKRILIQKRVLRRL